MAWRRPPHSPPALPKLLIRQTRFASPRLPSASLPPASLHASQSFQQPYPLRRPSLRRFLPASFASHSSRSRRATPFGVRSYRRPLSHCPTPPYQEGSGFSCRPPSPRTQALVTGLPAHRPPRNHREQGRLEKPRVGFESRAPPYWLGAEKIYNKLLCGNGRGQLRRLPRENVKRERWQMYA